MKRRRPSAVHDPRGYEDAVFREDAVNTACGAVVLLAVFFIAPKLTFAVAIMVWLAIRTFKDD